MKNKIKETFFFGEKIDGYDIKVLNEREVRAGAGILFFFAMVTFMTAFLTGNFLPTKIFVIAFLVDFTIRIFVNPKYSPSLILGRIAVRNQKPEYVGAPQKRFAWAIGFALSVIMFVMIILNNVIGPANMLVCVSCLILLFSETAFGVCWGCKIYNIFNKEKAKLCPGGTCEVTIKEDIQKINFIQILVISIFIIFIFNISSLIGEEKKEEIDKIENFSKKDNALKGCEIPDWVKKIGHEEKWKLHNNCN